MLADTSTWNTIPPASWNDALEPAIITHDFVARPQKKMMLFVVVVDVDRTLQLA
jgi:hypothetical protein